MTDATIEQLLDVARERFARLGYAGTSLEAIVRACGLTKGAVYHHFRNKRALFEAVYEREEVRLCAKVAAAGDAQDDPHEAARARWRAFLDAAMEPGLQRIALVDAPAVLGWERFREIASRHGLALIRRGLEDVMAPERERNLDVLSLMLHGGLTESALSIARAPDTDAAREAVEREFESLLADLAG